MQAVFPEGGLSLDGALAEPRLGILKYIVEGHDLSLRDVVFVPVAINYERVFEDRILVAAGQRGERRFRAKISVVAWFLVKQMWLRLRGRYHRFGYAAVSFGAPVHLHRFLAEEPEDTLPKLADQLMHRIAVEIPVLPVPLVARALLAASGPLDRAELKNIVQGFLLQLSRAHIHLPRDDLDYAVEVGLRNLVGRALVAETDGLCSIAQDGRPLIAYYAASIEHHFVTPE